MNLNAVAAMLLEGVVTIQCKFQDTTKLYTFLAPSDLNFIEGDVAVVDTANRIQFCDVISVDDEVDLDTESGTTYKWAFQKLNIDLLKSLKEQQSELAIKLRKQKRASVRKQALGALGVEGITAKLITTK